MRWSDSRRSENVEDRRGVRLGGPVGLGIGGVILALVAMYFGVDPGVVSAFLGQGGSVTTTRVPVHESPAEAEVRDFVSAVLAETEDVWTDQFARRGKQYREPALVLFRDGVESACGIASSAGGPFCCPSDGKVYLDLAFMDDLRAQLGAPSDFAQAYVIAENVMDGSATLHSQIARRPQPAIATSYSVRDRRRIIEVPPMRREEERRAARTAQSRLAVKSVMTSWWLLKNEDGDGRAPCAKPSSFHEWTQGAPAPSFLRFFAAIASVDRSRSCATSSFTNSWPSQGTQRSGTESSERWA